MSFDQEEPCQPIITVEELRIRFHRAAVVRGSPITVCPQCGQEQVRKVYSARPIEFKGHGFYRTDGRGGSGK